MIAAAKLAKDAASFAPTTTSPAVGVRDETNVKVTPPTVIASVATTELKLIVLE